jgi:hypothetical protein
LKQFERYGVTTVMSLEDARQLVADGVAHSMRDQVVDDAFVQAMKRRGVWFVPTFTADESFLVYGAA